MSTRESTDGANSGSYLPRVSIVTPSFNQGHFIEETISSVSRQDYPKLEHIVIDGGSSDATVDVLRRHHRDLAYWVSEADNGQAHALNKGFALAHGEILGWLNSDDTYNPGAIDAVVKAFARNPGADVVYGSMALMSQTGRAISRRWDMSGASFDLNTVLFDSSIPQPSTFWRRGIYERSGGLDESFQFCMDLDLWVRFALLGARFARISNVLSSFRIHLDAKTSRMHDVRDRERRLIVEHTLGRPVEDSELRFRGIQQKIKRLSSNPADLLRGVFRKVALARMGKADG